MIDGHAVDSQAIPLGQEFVPETPDPKWVAKHVRQTRYALQIVKCGNQKCCEPFKTNWMQVFPDRFVPFPAVYKYETSGAVAVEPSEYASKPKNFDFAPLHKRLLLKQSPNKAKSFGEVPFDLYSPSMKEKLEKGICKICDMYWPSAAAMLRHKKCHKSSDESDEETEEEMILAESDEENERNPESIDDDRMPVFDNIFEKLVSPFVEEE